MEKDKFKEIIVILIFIGISLAYYFYSEINSMNVGKNTAGTNNFLAEENNFLSENKTAEEEKIVVHLAGEVQKPGVYLIKIEKRLVDLIELAGGLTKNADLDKINLAAPLYDGDKIIIPTKVAQSEQIEFIYDSDYHVINPGSNDQRININKATAAELEKLSGIGPGKASSIIKYRNEKGRFKIIEDLLEVSGIGEKTLEKIKDEISVR